MKTSKKDMHISDMAMVLIAAVYLIIFLILLPADQ